LRKRNHHAALTEYQAPVGAEVIDAAKGNLSFPDSLIRMSTFICRSWALCQGHYETASQAALVGGTTTLIEMCCPRARKTR
jgi:dihydropyrimidinase